jgi:hypothetical protein
LLHLPPGRPHWAPPGEHRPLIPPRIALTGLTGAVKPVAVGLDDHALAAPEEVGLDRRLAVVEVDPLVYLG